MSAPPGAGRRAGVDLGEAGATGLRRVGGLVDQEFHPKLRGKQALRVFDQMRENDPVIGGVLFVIEHLIRQAVWRIEPAGAESGAEEAADLIEGALLRDMSHTWDDFLGESLSMLPFGWSVHEIVYKRRIGPHERDARRRSRFTDGRIGWRKLAPRAQSTVDEWTFGEDGGIDGFWQLAEPAFERVWLPIEKLLLFRPTSRLASPQGRSILRNAYRPWYFLTRLQEIEAIGIERDLAGFPVMQVPPSVMHPSADPEDRQIRQGAEKFVKRIRRDELEGAVVPSEIDPISGNPTGYKFGLLSTGGRRAIDVGAAIQRYEQRIAISVVADFMLLGTQDVGSWALSTSKINLFEKALLSVMGAIASPINRFAIPRLMRLNGVPEDRYPELKHGEVAAPPLPEIADFLTKLSGAGILLPDPTLRRKVREIAGLPEEEEETDET